MAVGMVIVGAGECGARAAFTLRESGWTGPVTLVGDERTDPYETATAFQGGDDSTGSAAAQDDLGWDSEAMCAADIEFVAGVAATSIDVDAHELALADGRRIGYRRLLLATGATRSTATGRCSPRRLPHSTPRRITK